MTKFLIITVLSFSCAATPLAGEKKDRGYCFKAEGVNKMRKEATPPRKQSFLCYPTSDLCWEKQSIISEQHPWAKITYECKRTVF